MNWSNCSNYDKCTDERKDIMTYCDVVCPTRPTDEGTMSEVEKHNQYLKENGADELDYILCTLCGRADWKDWGYERANCPSLEEARERIKEAVHLPVEPVQTTYPKCFVAYRRLDISETHDENQANPPTEAQFEGAVFSDGKVALRWLTNCRSVSIWDSFEDAMAIHGYPEYGTEIHWYCVPPEFLNRSEEHDKD